MGKGRGAALVACALALAVARPEGVADARRPRPLNFRPKGQSWDRFPVRARATRVVIQAHDGIALHARVFRPRTPRSWRTPVILIHSPYFDYQGNQAHGYTLRLVHFFTPKGYTIVLSDVRGTGYSGGCLEQDGRNQARDFKTLVEHFASRRWSNGRVGSYGISYDGEAQNAGAVLAPKGLKSMVTAAAISGLYEHAYFDGVPVYLNGPLGATGYAIDSAIPKSAPHRLPERPGCQPDNLVNNLDPSGDMTAYWREREFRRNVERVRASVLYVQGFLDSAVRPINIVGWYDELDTFKRAIFGQWGHAFPDSAPPAMARNNWEDLVHAWFDHELLGFRTGLTRWPAVQVQDDNGVWRAEPSFRSLGRSRRITLGPRGLGERGPRSATVRFLETEEVAWRSERLERSMHLSGQAFLDATITLDRNDAHFVAHLQEVQPNGSVRTLTTGYLSARHRRSLRNPTPVPVGEPVRYRVRTYPFDAILERGSRLRLVLSGIDPDNEVIPAGNGYGATVAVDGSSFLSVPVVRRVCGIDVRARADPNAPGCPRDLRRAVLHRTAPVD